MSEPLLPMLEKAVAGIEKLGGGVEEYEWVTHLGMWPRFADEIFGVPDAEVPAEVRIFGITVRWNSSVAPDTIYLLLKEQPDPYRGC